MLPFLAMIVPVLLLFCGLAVDVNVLQNAQMRDQLAADAAVTSSALEFQRGTGEWVAAARQTAALYGTTDGSNGAIVSAVQRPESGQFAGRDDAIQVSVSQPYATFFMRFVQSATVGASAVALLPPCIVLRGQQALLMNGSSLQTGCPVYSNGTMNLNGTNSWSSAGLLLSATGSINAATGSSVASGVRTMQDPLASVAQPRVSGCRATGFTQNGGSVTLQPGVYCNGITLRNANVTLASGLYIITGGAHWTGATVRGTGITLAFTNGSSGFGQFVIDGYSTVTLSAPVNASSTTVPGVVVFGDRAWQAQSIADFQIINATVRTDGVWYLTGTDLALSHATLSGPTYLGLDVDGLVMISSSVQGGADLSSVATGNPFQPLGGLAE